MARSVLICSTAWKGSLSPDEANHLIAEILKQARPEWSLTCLPLADGGDGWLECLSAIPNLVLATRTLQVSGPLPNQPVNARYLWDPQEHRVFLESAEIHGMRRLPESLRQPLAATSYGVGEALLKLLQEHPKAEDIIVSVGGSASTDGGLGFLQALGWQFFGAKGEPLTQPIGARNLADITSIQQPDSPRAWPTITILTDVDTQYADSPRLFGPQKGVTTEDIAPLTQAFQRVGALLDPLGQRLRQPGSGAAGGLPFGLLTAIPDAKIRSGIVWTAEALGFHKALGQADRVITGEGGFDETSLLGKVTGYVINQAESAGKSVVVLCGQSSFAGAFRPHVWVQPLYALGETVTPVEYAETPTRLKGGLLAALSATE